MIEKAKESARDFHEKQKRYEAALLNLDKAREEYQAARIAYEKAHDQYVEFLRKRTREQERGPIA